MPTGLGTLDLVLYVLKARHPHGKVWMISEVIWYTYDKKNEYRQSLLTIMLFGVLVLFVRIAISCLPSCRILAELTFQNQDKYFR